METWTHKQTYRRVTPQGYLVVTAGLHKLDGNERPYFSITAELWQSKGWYENGQDARMIACGQMSEEISSAFPKLRPLLALHLSDDYGWPMHAVANGRYWIEQGELETAARHFRCTVEELPTANAVEAWAEARRDRWEAEAAAGIVLLDN